jgi:hypothetical protein
LDRKLQFTYPLASIKDVQATGEASSPQKKTSSTSKHENSLFFSIFVGHFCPPGSGSSNSNYCGSMRIRIHNPGIPYIFFASALGISCAVCSFLVLSSGAGNANPHHHHVTAFRIDANPDPDVTAPFRVIKVKLFTVGGTALN